MITSLPELSGNYAAVYEDFERYFGALEQYRRLSKYDTQIIFPAHTIILRKFKRVCKFLPTLCNYEIVADIDSEVINKGIAYVSLMEDDRNFNRKNTNPTR
jgi:hypothetical protein